jgi:formyl-CoA transferase
VAILVGIVSETRGQLIDISESDCWAMIQTGLSVVEYIFGGRLFERQGSGRSGGPYPYALLRCKDGMMRIITIQRREWRRLLEVMGNPAWADDPRFQDRTKMTELYADELDALIEDWMKDKTKEEIFQLCREGGVPCAPTYTIDEVLAHPELSKWFVEVDQPGVGGIVQAGFPYDLSETPARIERAAPRLGEHTSSVLSEIGVDDETLGRLRAASIV